MRTFTEGFSMLVVAAAAAGAERLVPGRTFLCKLSRKPRGPRRTLSSSSSKGQHNEQETSEAGAGLGLSFRGGGGGKDDDDRARAWSALEAHAVEMGARSLRELMRDEARCASLSVYEGGPCGLVLDWSRQRMTQETMRLLFALARACEVESKRDEMRRGEHVNVSEDRPALHHLARGADDDDDDETSSLRDEREAARSARESALAFADAVRAGETRPPAADRFEAVVVCGIGGSQLGPEFAVRAVAPLSEEESGLLEVRFVANCDPAAFAAATRGLDPKTTLVVASSKSFGTSETLANVARARRWIEAAYAAGDEHLASRHFAACATRASGPKVAEAIGGPGAAPPIFELWDWVGGRFSSTASPGLVPVALAAGSGAARRFLDGARDMDRHFFRAPLEANLPVILALCGVWNRNLLKLPCRAVVAYSDRLARFAAHVQQLEMESSGKRTTRTGHVPLDHQAGEIVFGEPGTNAQHSFFQFLHAAEPVVPVDFIGFLEPENKGLAPAREAAHPQDDDDRRAHDLLMAHFFAQPDALALGTIDLPGTGPAGTTTPPYKLFPGDRPSLTLAFPRLEPYTVGALLALYEHRTAVQGWLWDINSWDQFGVELGKTIATDILSHISCSDSRRLDSAAPPPPPWTFSTKRMLDLYMEAREARGPGRPPQP